MVPPPGGRTGRQSQRRQPRAREDPLNKVCPSMLASFPASMLNQNSPDLGIPNRIDLKASRSSVPERTDEGSVCPGPGKADVADDPAARHAGMRVSGIGPGCIDLKAVEPLPDLPIVS